MTDFYLSGDTGKQSEQKDCGFGGVSDDEGTCISVTVSKETHHVVGLIYDKDKNQNIVMCTYTHCEEHDCFHWNAVALLVDEGRKVEDFPLTIPIDNSLEHGLEMARQIANEDLVEKIDAG